MYLCKPSTSYSLGTHSVVISVVPTFLFCRRLDFGFLLGSDAVVVFLE